MSTRRKLKKDEFLFIHRLTRAHVVIKASTLDEALDKLREQAGAAAALFKREEA